MPTYSELLRDPRWQKMRLKKLEAAEWRCERCMDSETTLNVHHKRYVKGRMPWEYDEAELAVLCEPCHEEEHESKDMRAELMARLAVDGPVGLDDFVAYGAGAISAYGWLVDQPLWELLDAVREKKPAQYFAGRIAGSLFELEHGDWRLYQHGFESFADLVHSNQEFGRELIDLLKKYGVSGTYKGN